MVQESFIIEGSVSKTEAALIDNNINFWFQIIEEDGLSLQSQITDNYIENNTAIQDHIALSPVTITLSGYIGETVYQPPLNFFNSITSSLNDFAANKFGITITDKLSPISALLPSVSNITEAARNAVQYTESSYRRYEKILNQFKSLKKKEQKQPTETVQQYTANKLKDIWQSRKMVEVITPWGRYEDMQILSINFRQGNTTGSTNLSVTLKQINYASTQTTQPNKKVMAMFNAIQRTDEANHGKAQGVKTDNSFLYEKFGNNSPYNTAKKS